MEVAKSQSLFSIFGEYINWKPAFLLQRSIIHKLGDVMLVALRCLRSRRLGQTVSPRILEFPQTFQESLFLTDVLGFFTNSNRGTADCFNGDERSMTQSLHSSIWGLGPVRQTTVKILLEFRCATVPPAAARTAPDGLLVYPTPVSLEGYKIRFQTNSPFMTYIDLRGTKQTVFPLQVTSRELAMYLAVEHSRATATEAS